MVLFISALQPQQDSPVCERFGRSPYYIKWDSETEGWEALPNPGVDQSGGAGITAAQFVVDQGGVMAVSGDFGPNAAKVLQEAGIQMVRFPEGVSTVSEVMQIYKEGKLQ